MRIVQELTPLIKAKLRGDECRAVPMSFFHELKEQTGLLSFHRDGSEFIDDETIIGLKAFDYFLLRMIGDGLIESVKEILKLDKAALVVVVKGMDKESDGKSCFPAACGTDKNETLFLGDEVHGVVEF